MFIVQMSQLIRTFNCKALHQLIKKNNAASQGKGGREDYLSTYLSIYLSYIYISIYLIRTFNCKALHQLIQRRNGSVHTISGRGRDNWINSLKPSLLILILTLSIKEMNGELNQFSGQRDIIGQTNRPCYFIYLKTFISSIFFLGLFQIDVRYFSLRLL